jgi:hypothetical protein
MPQHFHRLFFVLKIELKTEFCFLNHHLMSLNRKKILNIFLVNLYVKNIYFEKIPCFWAPFLAEAITAVGNNFLNFFLHILKDYFFNYKRCKFQKGFKCKNIF